MIGMDLTIHIYTYVCVCSLKTTYCVYREITLVVMCSVIVHSAVQFSAYINCHCLLCSGFTGRNV